MTTPERIDRRQALIQAGRALADAHQRACDALRDIREIAEEHSEADVVGDLPRWQGNLWSHIVALIDASRALR